MTTAAPGRLSALEQQMLDELASYQGRRLRFVKEVLAANPFAWQGAVLDAMDQGARMVAIRSCHGSGKTALLALLALCDLATEGWDTKVICTAPEAGTLRDALWPEITKWITGSPLEPLFEVLDRKVQWVGAEDSVFAVARTSSKRVGQQSTLAGRHAGSFHYLIDEASGVLETDWEVVFGAMTTPGSTCVVVGNPATLSGTFYEAFHKDAPMWTTFHVCAPVPVDERPAGALVSPGVTQDYIQLMLDRYGKDSAVYQIRVLGEFPTALEDSVIPLRWVLDARKRILSPHAADPVVAGLDWGGGGAGETALAWVRGPKVLGLTAWHGETKAVVPKVVAHHWALHTQVGAKLAPSLYQCDGYGQQSYAVAWLRDAFLQSAAARGVTAPQVVAVDDTSPVVDPTVYAAVPDALWGVLVGRFRDGQMDLTNVAGNDTLLSQLTTRKWGEPDRHGRMRLETKDQMERRGLVSPDEADALALACYPLRQGGPQHLLTRYGIKRGV